MKNGNIVKSITKISGSQYGKSKINTSLVPPIKYQYVECFDVGGGFCFASFALVV